VTFESDRLSLNKTNVNTLIKAYGPNDEDWIGRVVELYVGPLKYNGGIQEGVLVRPVSPSKSIEAVPNTPRPDMNDDIPF
jgi:hypothetical protein